MDRVEEVEDRGETGRTCFTYLQFRPDLTPARLPAPPPLCPRTSHPALTQPLMHASMQESSLKMQNGMASLRKSELALLQPDGAAAAASVLEECVCRDDLRSERALPRGRVTLLGDGPDDLHGPRLRGMLTFFHALQPSCLRRPALGSLMGSAEISGHRRFLLFLGALSV